MYYPYLRARQFELISLRELALEEATNKIVPVLEPLSNRFNNLKLANTVFCEQGFKPYLLVNPLEGDDDSRGDTKIFLEFLAELEDSCFQVAFHFNDNKGYIESSIEEYNLSNCMIVGLDNYSDEESLKELCNNSSVTHIMLLDPTRNRGLHSFMKTLSGKTYIRLDDSFEKEPRNAEYLERPARKFSEEHRYFSSEGFNGFGDFTVLPREFVSGGSAPMAVVIHFTYLNDGDDQNIWIRHFTSTSNDSRANVQGKFAEAAEKAIEFIEREEITNSAASELKDYFDRHHYPGLGVVKKISIKNHLLIIEAFLNQR